MIKYGGIIASAEKRKPLFFIFACDRDLQGYKTAENIPNVSFKIPSSGWGCWMKNNCLHLEMNCSRGKNENVHIASILSAWCLSKNKAYISLLWHLIKYFVLIQVTWGILQNVLFCFLLNLFKCIRNTVENQAWVHSKIYGKIPSGLLNETDLWHE